MISIGFHTDAFNTSNWNFEQCLKWAQQHDLRFVECAAIDGVYMLHSLGYWPHVALYEDPVLLRKKMDGYGLQLSEIDAAFPMSIPEGATLGVEYVLHTIRWAKMAGCPRVDTTDSKDRPEGMTDREVLDHLKRVYGMILPIAEAHGIIVNVEPHGYCTTRPELMAEILGFYDSPCFGMNMDTGNTFIAGQDPVKYLEQFRSRVNHIHIKDVSHELAAAMKGQLTGIALSSSAIGDGVNADNIRQCVELLVKTGFDGTMSLECDAQGGPLLERSLAWTRQLLSDLEARSAAAV